uniref:Putative mitogen-activated protein (MAP) kinase kinase kinase Ste11, Cryptococcus n=1 Tax=Helianthus annuus TaxID=4232 RepID=A0A251UHU7_HELAN
MFQLCKGLEYIHGLGVIHRDLKPQNVLYDEKNDMIKIADFSVTLKINLFSLNVSGLSLNSSYLLELLVFCKLQNVNLLTLGTPRYKAPEILLGMIDYYVGVDIWSLGCIFGMFLTWFQDVNIFFLICSVSNMYCKIVQQKCQQEHRCLLVVVIMVSMRNYLVYSDQLIIRLYISVLGLPNDVAWPGVVSKLRVKLKGWKNKHLNYQPQDLAQRFASLGVDGVDLLQRMLTYKPARMISARVALEHPYFAELRFMMVF